MAGAVRRRFELLVRCAPPGPPRARNAVCPPAAGLTAGRAAAGPVVAEQLLAHSHDGAPPGSRAEVEQRAVDEEGPERPYRRVVEALKMVLLDKGVASPLCPRRGLVGGSARPATQA